jgi:hypothetical protein
MAERYLYDHSSHRAVMYEIGDYLYAISGNKAEHWISGDYIFCMETQAISFWILERTSTAISVAAN